MYNKDQKNQSSVSSKINKLINFLILSLKVNKWHQRPLEVNKWYKDQLTIKQSSYNI
jgi:hypothetical protein